MGDTGPAGPQGATGTFDPTSITNSSVYSALATNTNFVRMVASTMLSTSNNYYLAAKKPQSLTFAAIPILTNAPNKTYTLNVTSSAGLTPVTYSVDNLSIATASNNVLTLLGAGSTTVTAYQAGNGTVSAVSSSRPLIVNLGTLRVGLAAIPTQSNAIGHTLTLNATNSANLPGTTYLIDNGSMGTFASNVLTIQGTGTATITATNSGNTYFGPAFATQKLIVK